MSVNRLGAAFLRFGWVCLRAGLGVIAGATLVLVLVLKAGGSDPTLTPCGPGPQQGGFSILIQWMKGLLLLEPGVSWICDPIADQAWLSLKSVVFVMSALVIMLFAAGLSGWRTTASNRPSAGVGVLAEVAVIAPTLLWALVLMASYNTAVVLLSQRTSQVIVEQWCLPGGPLWVRYGVATLALALGGGSVMQLTRLMVSEYDQVMSQDYILVAKANGLSITGRVLRNLIVPVLTRVVGLLPVLLGEVIVVEKLFALDGVGRELFMRLEHRDAPTLMYLTALFVGVTLLARGSVEMLSTMLYGTPEQGEQA